AVGAYGGFVVEVEGSSGSLLRSNTTTLIVNPPPQPTSFSISPPLAYAGNDPYTVTIGNAQNIIVDVLYTFVDSHGNSSGPLSVSITMNEAGQWTNTLSHYEVAGTFIYTGMKNHWRVDWVPVNSVTFESRPPKPASLSISPSTVVAGLGSYTMTV